MLLAAAVGGYLIGAGKISLPQKQAIPAPVSTDETANWKTYTDTKYGYTFKYPTNWFIKDSTKDIGGTNILNAQIMGDNNKININNYKIEVIVDNTTIDRAKIFLNYGDMNFATESTTTNIKLDGRDAIKAIVIHWMIDETGKKVETGKDYQILVSLNNNTLRITSNLDQQTTVDQILSTFRFIK